MRPRNPNHWLTREFQIVQSDLPKPPSPTFCSLPNLSHFPSHPTLELVFSSASSNLQVSHKPFSLPTTSSPLPSPSTHTSYLSLSFSSGPFTLTFISLPLGQLTLASLVWFAYQSLRCVHDSHSWFMSNYEKDYMKALYNPFTIRILYNFLS